MKRFIILRSRRGALLYCQSLRYEAIEMQAWWKFDFPQQVLPQVEGEQNSREAADRAEWWIPGKLLLHKQRRIGPEWPGSC